MSHLLSSRYVITSDNSFKPLPQALSYFLYTYMFTDTVPTPLTYVEPKFPLWSDYSSYFIMTVPVHIYVYTRLLQNVTFTTPPRLKQNNSQQKPHLVGTYISHPSFAYYAPTRSFPFFLATDRVHIQLRWHLLILLTTDPSNHDHFLFRLLVVRRPPS